MLTPRRMTAPAAAPVTVPEARAHVRYDDDDQDQYLAQLIQAAVDYLDGASGVLGRCIVAQTWVQPYGGWPLHRIFDLPFPDCSNLIVRWRDPDNVTRTVDGAMIDAPLNIGCGAAALIAPDFAYPTLRRALAPVEVEFVAGFGAPADVPASIKQAILIMVADRFRFRESAAQGASSAPPVSGDFNDLIAPLRRVGL